MAERRGLREVVSDGLRDLSELVVPWDERSGYTGQGYWGGVGFKSFDSMFSDTWDSANDKISSNYDAYRKIALVRNCIKLLSHFNSRNGFNTEVTGPVEGIRNKIKAEVDRINRKVNMDGILYQSVMVREIWGRSAYQIVRGRNTKLPLALSPLNPLNIRPVKDPKTTLISHYEYKVKGKDIPIRIEPDRMLYFPLDSLDQLDLGDSSISTLRMAIRRKNELAIDMLQAAKRCWAPFGIFQLATTKGKAASQIASFKDEIKPGMSIVTNMNVDGKIYDMKPDLNGLVRAEEKVDEEIMGNWQMPKALLSREKTMTKSTLEFSLHALYAGPVAGVQLFYRRQLERQWYDMIVRKLGHDPLIYRVKHIWTPMVLADANLIRALAYAVEKQVITKQEMFKILGWNLGGDEPDKTPDEPGPKETIVEP